MCGILGVVSQNNLQIELNQFNTALNSIEHRGPDDFGFVEAKNALIGMRRLSIMDVSTGKQPASSHSGRFKVVFNGEIYNYKDLVVRQFGDQTLKFSEAELIANLYEKEGLKCVTKFEGFFAIAIFDTFTSELILIRDRFGKKPLYYGENELHFFFASEVKAILKLGFPRQVDSSSIIDVLKYGHTIIPSTGFLGIHQVPPGHYLHLRGDKVEVKQFWKLEKIDLPADISQSEAKQMFRDKLLKSVEKRIFAERPLGIFLSGGIDSSLVLCAVRELGIRNIETFSIGFSHSDFDESRYAKAIADFVGSSHHELILEPDPNFFVETYPKFMDIPYADSSFLPTFMLSQFATQHIKVALSGDGGDESFGGYDRYRVNIQLEKLMKVVPPIPLPHLLLKDRLNNKLYRASKIRNFGDRYDSMMRLYSDNSLEKVFSTWLDDSKPGSYSPAHAKIRNSMKTLSDMQSYDVNQYLPSDLLVKMDMASMANGLEVRSPFLDPDLFAFGYSLPTNLKIRNGKGKFLARELLSDFLPRNLFERPKQGFAIPRAEWLRGPFKSVVHDILFSTQARSRGWFSQMHMAEIVKKHERGWDLDELIWPVLMVEIWARNWIDR